MGDLHVRVTFHEHVVEDQVMPVKGVVWLGSRTAAQVVFPGADVAVTRLGDSLAIRGRRLREGQRTAFRVGPVRVQVQHLERFKVRRQIAPQLDYTFMLVAAAVMTSGMWVDTLGHLAQDPGVADVTARVAELRDWLRPDLGRDEQQASANVGMREPERRRADLDMVFEGRVASPDDEDTGWNFYGWYRAAVPTGPLLSRARARLQGDPDDQHLHAMLARGEYDADNWSGAAAHYRNLVAYDGRNVAWLEGLAHANRRLGRHRQELELYSHLLELDPDNLMAMGYGGVALARLDQPDASMATLDELETLHPDHPYVSVFRGLTSAIDGQEAEAIASFEVALARQGELTDQQLLELRRDLALEPELADLRADPRMHRMLARQLGVMAPHKRH